ncbi:MAG: glycogen synthase GlgA [Candidatus Omnitrophota bacterium]
MNIIFASSEVVPFAKTGGLADVSASLPQALKEISCRVTVILPFYKSAKEMNLSLTPFSIGEFNFCRYRQNGIEYIFVVNDGYYNRDNLYSEAQGDYPDNDLRFSYFSRAVVAFAAEHHPRAEIIHCNDWQTGLVPLYLKIEKQEIKTLFTIHNIGYQGLFDRDALCGLGLPREFYNINGIEYYKKISFLKAGIVYSSAVSAVSKGYAREILTPGFGCGMDGILKTRASDLYGIVNGVDYSDWDPACDTRIAKNYDSETLGGKSECKKDLIKSANMPPGSAQRPLIGVISRLAEQKGIDLIVEAAEEIIKLGASIIILGTGDAKYNSLCRNIARRHPEYISSHITFDNALAHKIEAGCDMFAMPSRYEPCGLNQMYSFRYGTLPVVRATGGLEDTVIDIDTDTERGNGIKFEKAAKEDLINAVSRAIELYRDKARWQKIQKRIMKLDFSWKTSALHYKELYTKLLRG